MVRGLRSRGRTVILVSHFLTEVLDLSDVVTVLRDGRVVRTNPTAAGDGEQPRHRHARAAGRAARTRTSACRHRTHRSPWPIEGLSAPGVTDATLSLRAGEIVGLAGLVGAGRSELARAIYGANQATAGVVDVAGTVLPGRPAASIECRRRVDP